jgi:hypothetical protein
VPVSALLRELCESCARIGDRDELTSRPRADCGRDARPEELLHRRDFDRAAALARDEEQRLRRLQSRRGAVNRRLVGRVHDDELRATLADAVHRAHHFSAEAAAAHAQQVDRLDAVGPDLVGERLDRIDLPLHRRRRVEPAQAVRDRPADVICSRGPPGGDVAAPEASNEVAGQQRIGGLRGGRIAEGRGHEPSV